jgi:hypothetical protein
MEEKKFNCKKEDVPVLMGFALKSLEIDLAKFTEYSPIFTPQFIADAQQKLIECYDATKSTDVLKLQKVVTNRIADKSSELRLSLNPLEGYLNLAGSELDIQVNDFGLKKIRTAISKGNVEGLLSEIRTLITVVKRNEAPLLAKGMKPELITKLTNAIQEIEELNTHQNVKKNERSRVADDNIKIYNELWDILATVLSAGRAIFRGVDDVKLKEYTMTNLLKRVHSETGSSAKGTDTTITTDTTEVKSA